MRSNHASKAVFQDVICVTRTERDRAYVANAAYKRKTVDLNFNCFKFVSVSFVWLNLKAVLCICLCLLFLLFWFLSLALSHFYASNLSAFVSFSHPRDFLCACFCRFGFSFVRQCARTHERLCSRTPRF